MHVHELLWEGKYDTEGRRSRPVKIPLPFQTVETINESAQERQRSLDLFTTGRSGDWRNRLIWGDKKYVLPALADEFAGEIDLIYIDPPFATGANFSLRTKVPESDESFDKEPTLVEQKAYRDTWGKNQENYPRWFYEAIASLHPLLSPTGVLWVHCDWRISALMRLILDDVFGTGHFVNEIVWHYKTFQGQAHNYFAKKHDTLFLYRKSERFTYNEQFDTDFEDTIDSARWANYIDANHHITGARMPVHDSRFLRYLKAWERRHGREPGPDDIVFEVRGQPVDSVWDMKGLDPKSSEKVGYPTQKPEELLQRILASTSQSDDLVLDCFAGSGTTAVVAEKLGRRWIAADLGRYAVHTARKRLLALPECRPFVVQNLGKYERQAWQTAEFGETVAAKSLAYRSFIIQLYQGRPIQGYSWMHGLKQGRMVHVGTVDAPVTVGDVKQIAMEFQQSLGSGPDAPSTRSVDILGWDFAFELNEVARQEAQAAGIDMRFVRIPREVLDKRAVEQGDVRFFELAALAVDVKHRGKQTSLSLTDFIIPLDDVPADVQKAISNWSQWIDYWAVDWNNAGDTFHNQWQAYRSKSSSKLPLSTSHTYDAQGEYTVVVKVIDILGNDTTKSVRVRIPGRG